MKSRLVKYSALMIRVKYLVSQGTKLCNGHVPYFTEREISRK